MQNIVVSIKRNEVSLQLIILFQVSLIDSGWVLHLAKVCFSVKMQCMYSIKVLLTFTQNIQLHNYENNYFKIIVCFHFSSHLFVR